jgi:hypothetical protein
VVAFEVELLFGVLGAGAPGVGQGLEGVQLGGAGGGRRVAFAGGVGADVIVFGAGVGFGLPCPAGPAGPDYIPFRPYPAGRALLRGASRWSGSPCPGTGSGIAVLAAAAASSAGPSVPSPDGWMPASGLVNNLGPAAVLTKEEAFLCAGWFTCSGKGAGLQTRLQGGSRWVLGKDVVRAGRQAAARWR